MIKWLIFLLLISCNDNDDMRIFMQSLPSEQIDYTPVPIPDISTPVLVLDETDITEVSFYYFETYLSADFPMITGLTKKYFFVWSGDHATLGSYWGEGNNLDCTDFVEKGKCFDNGISGASTETPQLYVIGSKCFFYFHNFGGDTYQQTQLYTTTGGSLTDIDSNGDWVDEGRVLEMYRADLGNQINGIDETHTGYLTMNLLPDGTYQAVHLAVDASGVPAGLLRWSYSTDGITWVRDVTESYEKLYRSGVYTTGLGARVHTFGDRRYYIALSEASPNATLMALNTVDTDFINPTYIKEMQSVIAYLDSLSTYYDSDTKLLHIYYTEKDVDLFHTTLDMTDAYRWIL